MGRKESRIPPSYFREAPRWYRNYHTEWSGVLGDRVRRMRRAHGLTLVNLAERILRPDGGRYSYSYYSRLERGSSSPPLYVYLALAEFFQIAPGRLLGPDDAERDATQEEMVLIRFLRRAGVAPDAAIHALTRAGWVAPEPEPPGAPAGLPAQRELVYPPRQEMVKTNVELQRLDFGPRGPG